jgi:GNAT superfamily N-acetyltransferase
MDPVRPVSPASSLVPLPPGYPVKYQRSVTLRDGRRVLIRPIVPGDAPGLAEAIRTADADTIHRRFLGGRPRVTPELIAHLTTVDYARRMALVAIDLASERGVGIARYEQVGCGDEAEVAIAVSPDWRHAGLATTMVSLLANAAAERGIATFSGTYLAQNRPVAALISDADASASQIIEHGIAEFSVTLDVHRAASEADETAVGSSQPGTEGA